MFLRPTDLQPTGPGPTDKLAALRNALSDVRKPPALIRAQEAVSELRELRTAQQERHRTMCSQMATRSVTIGGARAVPSLVELQRLESEIKSLDTQISAAKRALQAEREAWKPTMQSNLMRLRAPRARDVIAAIELLAATGVELCIIDDYVAQNGLELHPSVNLPALDYLVPVMRKIAERG